MQPGYLRSNLKIDIIQRSKKSAPPSSYVSVTGTENVQPPGNISSFHSEDMEIRIQSPSVKVDQGRDFVSRSLPVFCDHDKICGTLHLASKLAGAPGRLTITMEGTFTYISSKIGDESDPTGASLSHKPRHVFFTSTIMHPTGETGSPLSATASSIRDAFVASVRPRLGRLDRRPSLQDLSASQRHRQAYPFSFEVPPPSRPGEEMPPTFSSVVMMDSESRGRNSVERAEVEYKIVAHWESTTSTEPDRRLEAPILFQPDTDFQSLDGLSSAPETWLEIPLRSDRPIRFTCAITLPVPSTFPRSASIPYFVVFTTNPRDPALCREIAVDATIAISLLRQVTIKTGRPSPPPSLHSPSLHSPTVSFSSSNASDESDTSSNPGKKLLRRVAKSSQILSSGHTSAESLKRRNLPPRKDKPLPDLPPNPGILDTRTLHTDMSLGFPKRPRNRVDSDPSNPPLDTHNAMPDGLYKGHMQLNKSMLPSIDWAGLSVKYFLEVSVLFGQDELRARVPVRIF